MEKLSKRKQKMVNWKIPSLRGREIKLEKFKRKIKKQRAETWKNLK